MKWWGWLLAVGATFCGYMFKNRKGLPSAHSEAVSGLTTELAEKQARKETKDVLEAHASRSSSTRDERIQGVLDRNS